MKEGQYQHHLSSTGVFNKSYTSWMKISEGSTEGWSLWALQFFSTWSCHFRAITMKPRCVVPEYIYSRHVLLMRALAEADDTGPQLQTGDWTLLHQCKSERKGERKKKTPRNEAWNKSRCKIFYWLQRWQDENYSSSFVCFPYLPFLQALHLPFFDLLLNLS